MKKLLITIAVLLTLIGCTGEPTEETAPYIDVPELAKLTYEDATEKYGELTKDSTYVMNDGTESVVYTTSDNIHEFYFTPDGTKLLAYYNYVQEPIEVKNNHHMEELFNITIDKENASQVKNVTRYYDVDTKGIIKELYLMGDGYKLPLSVKLIQIWFN